MEPWLVWICSGVVLVVLEFLIPGAIMIFVGAAAMIVGGLLKFGLLEGAMESFLAVILISLFLLLVLRTFFLRYLEGDTSVQNVNEDRDAFGTIVEVSEDITPYREGRVQFRGAGWQARSDSELSKGSKAVITGRDGQTWIVKSL